MAAASCQPGRLRRPPGGPRSLYYVSMSRTRPDSASATACKRRWWGLSCFAGCVRLTMSFRVSQTLSLICKPCDRVAARSPIVRARNAARECGCWRHRPIEAAALHQQLLFFLWGDRSSRKARSCCRLRTAVRRAPWALLGAQLRSTQVLAGTFNDRQCCAAVH